MKKSLACFASTAFLLNAAALSVHATVVGQWVAADLPAGAVTTWSDRVAARPATNSGGPTKTTAGVVLDGNDALVVPTANNPLIGDNTWSATVVCRVTAGATRAGLVPGNAATWWGNSFLVGRELGGSARGDWGVGVNSLHGAFAARGNPDNGVIGTTALNDNLIHVVTGVFNGTAATVVLFVDGVKVGTLTGSGTSNVESDTLNFGVNILGNGDTTYFNGALLEIQLDNAVLLDAEVTTLQNTLLSTYRSGPTITSFTVTPTTAYEGQNVDLTWSVGVASVTGVYSYRLLRGATQIATGTATTGTFTTTIPDLLGTAQTVSYTLQAIETGGSNVTATATVSVAADPGLPTASPQVGLSTAANTPLNITLAGTDPNGGTLSYILVTPPTHGSLSAGTGAARVYTPTSGVYGADQFTFKVSDGKYESAPATVRLTVLTPPLAPTAVLLDDTTIRPENGIGDFLSNLSAVDGNVGEAHTFTLVSGAGSAENGNFSIVGHQLRAAVSFAGLTGVVQHVRVRATDAAGLWVEQSFLLNVVAKVRRVVINEIHYNGSNNSVRNAFVELYNDTLASVNLAGWRLSGAVDYLFPVGTNLAAGGYLIVAEDPATILSYWGKTALGPWNNAVIIYPDGSKESNNLPNDGGNVRLRDAANNVVSSVDYGNHTPWPADGNGEGTSIELLNPNLDESHGSNWAAAKGSGGAVDVTYVAAAASGWKYFKGTTAPASSWNNLTGADLTGWLDGTTTVGNVTVPFFGFGYGDNDDAVVLSDMQQIAAPAQVGYQAVYFRHDFTIPAGQMPSALGLRVYVDDGCIAYLNGVEIPVRFYVSTGTPSHAVGATTITGVTLTNHEAAPNNWDTYTITNLASYNLVEGTNVVCVLAANDVKTSSDFSFNLELKKATTVNDVATPGAKNIRFTANVAPAVREVQHTPQVPTSTDPIVITTKVTDPNGVASVALAYQIVVPGNFIPATLPKAISGGNFVSVATPLAANPAFEAPANWTILPMNDDGLGDDVLGGDNIWTATVPPQGNRTLVRYRITVTDNLGNAARVPYAADRALNYGCYVYNGVPAYEGTSAADLQTLPVYQLLTRKADYDQCVGYNPADRLVAGTSWNFENWEACIVYDGVVYDHIPYRLKGANGRYVASGTGGAGNAKRAFKFYFHKGYELQARDQSGKNYPTTWNTMITENLWENRASYTFSLNEAVDFYLFNQLGVPAPLAHFGHLRSVMQTAEQPDRWHGDFWGLMWMHEDYDHRFLQAHNLKKGNLYKLTRDGVSGILQFRYQSSFGPTDGSDHDELQNNLKGTSTPAYITGRVNLDQWCRYHAFCEAIRHYDYWPSGDNNAAYYFYPNYQASNGNKGVLWYLPNDLDATWGPTWNNGQDLIHNALFNDAVSAGGDVSTNPTLWPNYFNQIREVRALLWQQDQMNPLIDQFAAIIRPFVNAEFKRWHGAPADAGNFDGLFGPNNSALNAIGQTALDQYVAGMKDFAFDADNNGGVWPGANVGIGGRAAYLDTLGDALGENATLYPSKPTITFAGTSGYPVNDLRFTTSAFSDPQGAATFAGIQWRIAQVNTTGTYLPTEPRLLEITPSHDSGDQVVFTSEYKFPATACEPGKRYRARVRMKDATGRWSYWSNAAEFTAGSFDPSAYASQIVISEIMYHASNPTVSERAVAAALVPAQTWNDDSFDYVELRNVSAAPVDLTNFQFTAGFDFIFPAGTILAPGATVLVVQNIIAFNTRYGSGKPIAGAWSDTDRLSNGGEILTLQYGLTLPPIFSFAYDDDPLTNWPTAPDGTGASLVKIFPEQVSRDPSVGLNWRSSLATPGSDDRINFPTWLGAISAGDPDQDGLDNLVEYALGGDALTDSSALIPTASFQPYTVAGIPGTYATLEFQRSVRHEDFTQQVEFSTNLVTWPISAVHVSNIDHGNGTRTEVWRSSTPVASNTRIFGRARFTRP